MVESLPIIDRVAQDDSMGSPVEDFGDGAEGLLTSGIPNLEFKQLVLNSEADGAELDANRAVVLGVEAILCEASLDARLAHA